MQLVQREKKKVKWHGIRVFPNFWQVKSAVFKLARLGKAFQFLVSMWKRCKDGLPRISWNLLLWEPFCFRDLFALGIFCFYGLLQVKHGTFARLTPSWEDVFLRSTSARRRLVKV